MKIELSPLGVSFEVEPGATLANMLAALGVEFPCGGSGLCGGCRVQVLQGTLPPTSDDQQALTQDELAAGWRLACRARPRAPLKLAIGQWNTPILTDSAPLPGSTRTGLGIAVDLGTTTVVAQMIDLATGQVLGVQTSLNPQAVHGADVMNRVRFALGDRSLTPLIRQSVGAMVAELAAGRESEVSEITLVGNTVMHHLFAGLDVEPLSHFPFASPNLGEQRFNPQQLQWPLLPSCDIRFVPCVGGFVGADTLAGILAVDLPFRDSLTALIDLGTNGEIALGNRSRILCASTAAGPAFEAASIRMGMRAAVGAISHVSVRDERLECTVIGDVAPRGICGSGLVDAVAAGLDSGAILPSGKLANGAREFLVSSPVVLHQSDVRELQLAKAAIASGMRILLQRWGAAMDDVQAVYLSGAFGNYVRVESAIRTGLVETLPQRIIPSGNTALRGAKLLLASKTLPPLDAIEHVSLAADPNFQEEFVNCLGFPEGRLAPLADKTFA